MVTLFITIGSKAGRGGGARSGINRKNCFNFLFFILWSFFFINTRAKIEKESNKTFEKIKNKRNSEPNGLKLSFVFLFTKNNKTKLARFDYD